MITKHFFKTLLIFIFMIALGLLGVMYASKLDGGAGTSIFDTNKEVAK